MRLHVPLWLRVVPIMWNANRASFDMTFLNKSKSKQKQKIWQKEAYSLFWSHFFGFAKKTSNNPTFMNTVRADLIWIQAGRQRFFNFVPVTSNLWLFVTFCDVCDGPNDHTFEFVTAFMNVWVFSVFLNQKSVTKTENKLLFAEIPVSVWNSIGPNRKLQSLLCLRLHSRSDWRSHIWKCDNLWQSQMSHNFTNGHQFGVTVTNI